MLQMIQVEFVFNASVILIALALEYANKILALENNVKITQLMPLVVMPIPNVYFSYK